MQFKGLETAIKCNYMIITISGVRSSLIWIDGFNMTRNCQKKSKEVNMDVASRVREICFFRTRLTRALYFPIKMQPSK